MMAHSMPITQYDNLFLAQAGGGIELPTDVVPGAPGGAATGSPGGRPAQEPFGGSGFLMVVVFVVGAMIIFSMFGQRRDKKKREAMLGALKKHDKVQTIGGVIGSVVEVKPELVVLKVDESSNTRITITRGAIQQVLSPAVVADAGTKDDHS
jgi:preprotein translocase subunit YajC